MVKLFERHRTNLLFDRGVLQAERGNYQRALDFFEVVLERAPDFALAYANAGFCHFKLGKADAALSAYEQARILAPEDAELFYDMGCIHHSQGRKQDAMECFQEALRLQPNHAEAYSGMEQVRIELGLPAITTQVRLGLDPDFAGTSEGRAQRVLPAVEATDWLQRGEDAFEKGNFDEALNAWEEAARSDPTNPKPHNNRAAVLLELGRHQEAIDACAMALRVHPNYAVAHMTRGEIFAAMGNRDAVMREYTVLNQLDEEMAQALLDMIEGAPEREAT